MDQQLGGQIQTNEVPIGFVPVGAFLFFIIGRGRKTRLAQVAGEVIRSGAERSVQQGIGSGSSHTFIYEGDLQ